MESWQGYNYLTSDPRKWVELMNMSTVEWNIGPLPSNVIALPGSLAEAKDVPPGSLAIEYASRANVDSRNIEAIVFGASSGLIIFCGACWVGYNIWRNGFRGPFGSTDDTSKATGDVLPTAHYRAGNFSADTTTLGPSSVRHHGQPRGAGPAGTVHADYFDETLKQYYEEIVQTELYEKTLQVEGVDSEDVEAGTELLRLMYGATFELWSSEHASETTEEDRELWARKKAALLADYTQLIETWRAHPRMWEEEELAELKEIAKILRSPNQPLAM